MIYSGIYYVEMDQNKSLVWGLKVLEEKTDGVWGYVIFQDILEERQRIISLVEKPKSEPNTQLECINDIGETFRFFYLDQKTWSEKAHQFLKIPEERAKELTTTEAIQNFFKGI